MEDIPQFILRTNYDKPSNYVEEVKDFGESCKMTNPTCGDVVEVGINIHDNILEEIVFSGSGCVLSIASASIMTKTLNDSTVDIGCAKKNEVLKIMDNDLALNDCSHIDSQEIKALSSVNRYSSRIHCVKLAWLTFEQCLC